jgi:hypothetical protein
MHSSERIPSSELSTKQTELLDKAGLLAESNIARRETRYSERSLTLRERAGYVVGRLVGTMSKADNNEKPNAIVRLVSLQKAHKQSDHSSVWIGQSPEGYDRYLDTTTVTNFDTNEQQTTVNVVDTREATNPRAASDYSAHITETMNITNLLEPLSSEEVSLLHEQFDKALDRAETAHS